MKLNDGDAAAKIGENEVGAGGGNTTTGNAGENASGGGDPVKKSAAPTTPRMVNGETMSRETSRLGAGGESPPGASAGGAERVNGVEKPLTNGVLPSSQHRGGDDVEGMDVDMLPSSHHRLGKGKAKELNGDSLPSPESLSAS